MTRERAREIREWKARLAQDAERLEASAYVDDTLALRRASERREDDRIAAARCPTCGYDPCHCHLITGPQAAQGVTEPKEGKS
jgi:hypothetical protein